MQFNLITNPRRAGWLVRAFAMKVAGSPAPTLAPEVAPSIDVNQMDDPTLHFLRGARMQACHNFFTASVGNVNRMQIRNPSNSGVLLLVTQVTNSSTNVMSHGSGVQAGDLAGGALQPQPRDSRWFSVGGTRGTALASWDQTAAPAVPLQYVTLAAAVHEVEMVVPPGSAWQCMCQAANVAGNLVVTYLEVPVQAEELSTG